MSSPFFQKSKDIANTFIQSIVFLDDKAYLKENTDGQGDVNDLDAHEISKLFAKEKKICAVYDPETETDIEDFKIIAIKSDVVILDWFIDIVKPVEEGNGEDDAEDDDVRGKYTIDIISNLLEEGKTDNLKIILVYTGETNLVEIAETIQQINPGLTLNQDSLTLYIKNVAIIVRAKSNNQDGVDNRFVHMPQLQNKVLKYDQLPDFILEEFTKQTSGLLSNFALLSLATLRNNTSKILGLYNKNLDHAYLEHKSSIPNPEDAENLLIEIFKDSIGDLLHYKQIQKKISKTDVSQWIDETLSNEDKSIKKADGTNVNPEATFERDKKLLLSLLYSSEKDVQLRFMDILEPLCGSKGKAEAYYKYLKLNNIDLFINSTQENEKAKIITDFAKLTHHKNVFLPLGIKPILSLGTVLKSNKTGKYYICIQQRCDSVRIQKNEARKFLFIPMLVSTNEKFNFITQDSVKLKLDTKSYSLRTLKFESNKNGVVEPTTYSGKYYFKQMYKLKSDEKFQWILDLKDLHAQRIVSDYAATLSRVGLDESEWLRKSGIN